MTQHSNENLLRSYYKTLDRRHEELRRELLNSLCDIPVVPLSNAGSLLPSWLPSLRLVSAALVIIAVGFLFSLSGGPTQPAYGLEGLTERLASIRSLHLKGWIYQTMTSEDGEEKVEKFPTELYVKRPNYIGYRTYGFSIPGGGKPSTVSSGFMANDGKQAIYVSHDEKKATVVEVSPDAFHTELLVESFVQSSMAEKFLLGPPNYYRKVRSEKIEDVLCDVYEYEQKDFQLAGRHRIWLNQQSGIPMKYESSSVNEAGEEKILTSEVMQVNVEPPASLFSFQTPEGYELTKVDANEGPKLAERDTKLQRFGEGGSDTTWFGSWHCFNIEDRSALACWYQYDSDEEQKNYFARQPEFELYLGNVTRPCREHTLSTNNNDKDHWRWSLILPEDGRPIGEHTLRIKVSDEKTSTSQELKPLRFPRERLQEILKEAQDRTLPNESRQKLFTMEDLKAVK